MNSQVTEVEKGNSEVPEMKSLSQCINKIVQDGYAVDFKVDPSGLRSLQSEKIYNADEVKVVNFFRFEGVSDPQDNSILYVIETADGTKGTLVDAYGPYADVVITAFMKDVDEIAKKTGKR